MVASIPGPTWVFSVQSLWSLCLRGCFTAAAQNHRGTENTEGVHHETYCHNLAAGYYASGFDR